MKSAAIQVCFHVGGPDFHPVADQAKLISEWIGPKYACTFHHDKEIFDQMERADVLVIMGLFYSKQADYRSLSPNQEAAFDRYIASGKPLILHHGAAASYDDSEVFKRLIGINWVWGGEHPTQHSPLGDYVVRVTQSEHALMRGVSDYSLYDELYYDLQTHSSLRPEILAEADYEGARLPMVQCFEGGRVEGAGKAVYLANGHDLRAFECPAMRQLWINSFEWVTVPAH